MKLKLPWYIKLQKELKTDLEGHMFVVFEVNKWYIRYLYVIVFFKTLITRSWQSE